MSIIDRARGHGHRAETDAMVDLPHQILPTDPLKPVVS